MKGSHRLIRLASCLLAAWLSQTAAVARIYVADGTLNQINIYPNDASGNVAPTVTISGSNTGLSSPYGVATDANYIYVANFENTGSVVGNSVTIYPIGASGNASPAATIIGSSTGLANCVGIAVDASYIYVVNEGTPAFPLGCITVYPLSANGNVVPVATIGGTNTSLADPEGIAVDANYIYVSDPPGGLGAGTVNIFALGANGNATPAVLLNSAGMHEPTGIAVDANYLYVTNIQLVSGNYEVVLFALAGLGSGSSPSVTLAGADTGLGGPNGIAVNSGTIFVRNPHSNSVTAYPVGSTGDTAPTSTLGGANTDIETGLFVTVDNSSFTHLTVVAPPSAFSGTPFDFTVTAQDDSGDTVTGYSGTVHFTCTDTAADLPANSTLTSGTGTFPATLNTLGSWTITATDTVTARITGTSGPIVVSAAPSPTPTPTPDPVPTPTPSPTPTPTPTRLPTPTPRPSPSPQPSPSPGITPTPTPTRVPTPTPRPSPSPQPSPSPGITPTPTPTRVPTPTPRPRPSPTPTIFVD